MFVKVPVETSHAVLVLVLINDEYMALTAALSPVMSGIGRRGSGRIVVPSNPLSPEMSYD
jgi:hypothetical protein